jgi:hypothetical protein
MESLGFRVKLTFPASGEVKPQDVVITWNLNPRYRPAEEAATRAGAALMVAENGYIPKAGDTTPYYALARNGHNGSGFWYVGAEDRWTPLGQTIRPWVSRPDGYILVADQRGIGSELMKCPRPFYETVAPKIERIFAKAGIRKPPAIRLREHPGRHVAQRSLTEDFSGARAVVTWASNVANEALLAGLPTFRVAPYHVNEAALTDLHLLLDPPQPDRLPAFKKLAWAQWSLREIETGTAFRSLLRDVL